jgi:hypothetical protein
MTFCLSKSAISITKIGRMGRALHGDEEHPLIAPPLGERVRVRGRRYFLKDFGSSDLWSESFTGLS